VLETSYIQRATTLPVEGEVEGSAVVVVVVVVLVVVVDPAVDGGAVGGAVVPEGVVLTVGVSQLAEVVDVVDVVPSVVPEKRSCFMLARLCAFNNTQLLSEADY